MTVDGSKGTYVHVAWLCALAAFLAVTGYVRPGMQGGAGIEHSAATVDYRQNADEPFESGPTPADLAVYLELHHGRDQRQTVVPRAHSCNE